VAYAVFSLGTHLLGLGNKYLIRLLEAFKYGQHGDNYALNVSKATLEQEEGFDKNESLTQMKLLEAYTQYKLKPYWRNEVLSHI
jgi:hypothetical protein